MPRDTRQYLVDIVETADRISLFVHDMEHSELLHDEKTQVHEYFGVDLWIVWQAATAKAPALREVCARLLSSLV